MSPTEGRVAKPERRWGCRRGTHKSRHVAYIACIQDAVRNMDLLHSPGLAVLRRIDDCDSRPTTAHARYSDVLYVALLSLSRPVDGSRNFFKILGEYSRSCVLSDYICRVLRYWTSLCNWRTTSASLLLLYLYDPFLSFPILLSPSSLTLPSLPFPPVSCSPVLSSILHFPTAKRQP